MATSAAFNRLYDYHVKLDNIYYQGVNDGYYNGYYGTLYGDTVEYKTFKSKDFNDTYKRGYDKGYHNGWLDS
jgi:hypothetical protein